MDVRARVRRALSARSSPTPRLSERVGAAFDALRGAMSGRRGETSEVLAAAERARLIREFVAARELERRRLWEKLHDHILQTTAGNLLRLDAARVLLDEGRAGEARALLLGAVRTERRVFDDLRRLMTELHVEPPPEGRVASDDPLRVVVSIPEPEKTEAPRRR